MFVGFEMRGILDREKHILKHSPSDAGQYVWSRVLMGAGTIFFGACSFVRCGNGGARNKSKTPTLFLRRRGLKALWKNLRRGACSFACCGDGGGTNRSRLFLIVSCFIESLYREARALHVLCPYHSVLEF